MKKEQIKKSMLEWISDIEDIIIDIKNDKDLITISNDNLDMLKDATHLLDNISNDIEENKGSL